MKLTNKILVFSIAAMSFSVQAQQDKQLSMWHENMSMINPATVGVMDEEFRFLTNFRLQWLGVDGNSWRTNSLSVDAKLIKDRPSTLGVGINFTNDQTGDARLTSNVISIPISYNLAINDNNYFSLGVAPGFYSMALGSGNQTWDSQWNGIAFDQSYVSGENGFSSASSFDLGAGLQYRFRPDAYTNFNIGASVNHITTPDMSMNNMNAKLYRNYNFYINSSFFMYDRNFGISPQVLVSMYGPNQYVYFGTYFDHELVEPSRRTDFVQRNTFSYGIFCRWNDAVILSAMYRIKGFKVGFSYDFNYSKLRAGTKTFGALEFFLKYSIMSDRHNYIRYRRR